jgi:hypothetical protein
MKDRYASTGRDYCGKRTIGIAKDQDLVRTMLGDDVIDTRNYLAELFAECRRSYAEMNVRRSDSQIADKDVTQALMKILSGMNGDMLAILVEELHHPAQPDDLRTRAEDRHYFYVRSFIHLQ